MGIYLVADAALVISSFESHSVYHFRYYKSQPFQTGPASCPAVPFRLTRNGCPVSQPAAQPSSDGRAFTLAFASEGAEMDGFDLLAPVAGCPFPSILGSNSNDSNDDPSAGWVTLAAPGFRVARRSLRVFDPDDLSQASFRLRQPWPPRLAAAAEAAEGVLLIVLCAAATAVRTAPAGRAGRWAAALPRTGAIWAWTAAAAVTEVAHGAGLLLGGHTREALLPLAAWVPLRIAAGVAALLAPAHSAAAALAAGAAGVAARAAGDCLALRDCAGLSADPPCVPAALAAAGAALLLLQRRARSRIRAAYLADCALSDAAWEAARPDPAGLARLRDMVAAAAAACNGKEQARQWDQSTGAPVESLDRLLAQAIGVSPFLRARVTKWAGVQVGTEPSESGQGLQGEGQARQGTGGGWAKSLKDPRRAVEKAVRCYGRDASRLLDLCRVRLAFDGPGQVVDFLERMASDPSARVVRFKDGMCGGPGRAALEGFRVSWQPCAPRAHLVRASLSCGMRAVLCQLMISSHSI